MRVWGKNGEARKEGVMRMMACEKKSLSKDGGKRMTEE